MLASRSVALRVFWKAGNSHFGVMSKVNDNLP